MENMHFNIFQGVLNLKSAFTSIEVHLYNLLYSCIVYTNQYKLPTAGISEKVLGEKKKVRVKF